MSIIETITEAFSASLSDPLLTEEQIRGEEDPMMRTEDDDLLDVIPCYMLYCAKRPDDDSLVSYYTVNALAEYGRCKDPENDYLNFKFKCCENQKKAVADFLLWAKSSPLYEDEDQIDRSLKNWR